MHRRWRDSGGQVGAGEQAASAFQGAADNRFDTGGVGAPGEGQGRKQAAEAGWFDDDAAHRRVLKKGAAQ
jgi:hypothetical protein